MHTAPPPCQRLTHRSIEKSKVVLHKHVCISGFTSGITADILEIDTLEACASWAGREKVQRSMLSVRDGPTAEQVVSLAFKGMLLQDRCASALRAEADNPVRLRDHVRMIP